MRSLPTDTQLQRSSFLDKETDCGCTDVPLYDEKLARAKQANGEVLHIPPACRAEGIGLGFSPLTSNQTLGVGEPTKRGWPSLVLQPRAGLLAGSRPPPLLVATVLRTSAGATLGYLSGCAVPPYPPPAATHGGYPTNVPAPFFSRRNLSRKQTFRPMGRGDLTK